MGGRRRCPATARSPRHFAKSSGVNSAWATRLKANQGDASEPRKGRHHKARRVNAGAQRVNAGTRSDQPNASEPRKGRDHTARRVNAWGAIRPTQCIRAPQGARSYSPACQRLGSDSTNPMHPSPARGDIIKPGVSTPGERFDQPNASEPRKGRHHTARRVNARGSDSTNPMHPSPARGEIIQPGVSTPGERFDQPNASEPRKGRDHTARRVNAGGAIRPTQCIRAPQGATS